MLPFLLFFPHPKMVLQKEAGIKLINTIEERKEIIKSKGVDRIIVHPFTKEFSRLTAQRICRADFSESAQR